MGGGIDTQFADSGALLRVAGHTLELSLLAIGHGRQLAAVGQVAPAADGSHVVYHHRSVSESYRNGPYGLEQAFSVQRRPRGVAGPLTLALTLGGTLGPHAAAGQILFQTAAGATVVHYGQLAAFDAGGRRLATWMRTSGGILRLFVSDRGARYPVVIDPFLQQGSKLTAIGESGSGQL